MAKPKKIPPKPRDDDDEMPVVEPLPLDPVPKATQQDDSNVLDQGGKGSAVARALMAHGLVTFLAVTNKGVNLVAANPGTTAFLPVKITSRSNWPTLDLKKDDIEKLEASGTVVVFLNGEGDGRKSWYLTVTEFRSKAEPRGEGTFSIRIDDHTKWLTSFEGESGIRRAFKRLLK